METNLLHLTHPEAESVIRSSQLAVIPLGSIEQHGPHLPCGTDYLAALDLARRVAEKAGGLLVPFLAAGVAHYHMPFAGTITLRPETFIEAVKDVVASLAAHGVRRFLLVNAHEGNIAPLQVAASVAAREHRVRILIIQSFMLANELFGDEAMELTHAGGAETAAVLAYDPSLVKLDRATSPSPLETSVRAHARFRRKAVQPVLTDFREIAPTGWYGSPQKATRELGRAMVERVADRILEIMAEELPPEPAGR